MSDTSGPIHRNTHNGPCITVRSGLVDRHSVKPAALESSTATNYMIFGCKGTPIDDCYMSIKKRGRILRV